MSVDKMEAELSAAGGPWLGPQSRRPSKEELTIVPSDEDQLDCIDLAQLEDSLHHSVSSDEEAPLGLLCIRPLASLELDVNNMVLKTDLWQDSLGVLR